MWTWNSDPFGTDAANPNPSGVGAFAFNLRFPGQVFDGQAGLHANYFRSFDPASGRYTQSDLIGLAGGNYSTYGYTYESPINMSDPSGLVTAVVINNNTPVIGSHAGLYTSNSIYNGSMIYDPSGTYQNDTRGDGGFSTPGNILDYIHYQMGDGIDVQTLIFNTTPAEETEISQRVDNYGDPRGFKCADSVARVLDGIGPFKGLGKLLNLNTRRFVVTPRELLSALKTLQQSKN